VAARLRTEEELCGSFNAAHPAPSATNADAEAGIPERLCCTPNSAENARFDSKRLDRSIGTHFGENDMQQPSVVFLRADRPSLGVRTDRFFGPQPSLTSTVKQGVLTNPPSRKRIRLNKVYS
jgi:hypothetical protein